MAPPEISVTKSLTDCDFTQQMVGGIKAGSPGMMSMSADMFPDLPTMSAPSGEERKLGAAAQVERAGRCCRQWHAHVLGPCHCHGLGLTILRWAAAPSIVDTLGRTP